MESVGKGGKIERQDTRYTGEREEERKVGVTTECVKEKWSLRRMKQNSEIEKVRERCIKRKE